jgi:hypothetical protein
LNGLTVTIHQPIYIFFIINKRLQLRLKGIEEASKIDYI